MTPTAGVSSGRRVWLRRLILTTAGVAIATRLSSYDLLIVAAVSALMVATVKGLQLEVSRSRRKAIGGGEPFAPALPPRARDTASPAVSVAVSASDTAPSRGLRVLRSPDVGDSGTSPQTTSPDPAGRDPKPAVPGSQRGRLTRREEALADGAGAELGPDFGRGRPLQQLGGIGSTDPKGFGQPPTLCRPAVLP